MKNRLQDLNDHLFAQMERLSEEGIAVEQIEAEVKRTDAIVAVSDQIIANANFHLKAAQLIAHMLGRLRIAKLILLELLVREKARELPRKNRPPQPAEARLESHKLAKEPPRSDRVGMWRERVAEFYSKYIATAAAERANK